MSEILIVGAGPVGLTLAIELTRYRVPVRIIDRAASATDKSKAMVVWPRTLELLDRAGLAAAMVETGLVTQHINLVAGNDILASVGFDDLPTPYPFALLIPQSDTEHLLEQHLASLGVEVERNTELESFVSEQDGVTCTLRQADGTIGVTRFDWLLGCDGARSTVRGALKLDFAGDTLSQSFVLADVAVTGLAVPKGELAVFWSEDGPLLVFPMRSGLYRIVADVGTEARHDPTLAEMQAIVDARAPGVRLSDPTWLSGFIINERMVPSYRVDRVFVAGDAAHIHSPAGGQGMNTGMHDAINLAWKLALVQRGMTGPALLDSYSQERSGVAKEVLSDSGRMTRAGLLRNHLAQEMRNFLIHTLLGFHGIRNKGAARMSELTVHYADSPLNRGSAWGLTGPGPGERIVDGVPFGAGDTPRFALLAEDSDEARAFLKRHALLVEPDLRAPLSDRMIRLVRPDGYVAAVAPDGGWETIEDCLEGIGASARLPQQ